MPNPLQDRILLLRFSRFIPLTPMIGRASSVAFSNCTLELHALCRIWPSRMTRLSNSGRSEEHTSELQSLMRISYAVFCLKKKNKNNTQHVHRQQREHTNVVT